MIAETKNPTQEITLPENSKPQTNRLYADQDFRQLYEEEYRAHQETKRKLRGAEDRIEYLESKIEKLEADLAYLRKLFFARKTEQGSLLDVGGKQETQKGEKTHGAQKGHKGSGRNIPDHLPTEDECHEIPKDKCLCPQCGLGFEDFAGEEISYEVTVRTEYVLIRHRRKKYKKTCSCPGPIVTTPGPLRLFEGGLYSIAFWIQVLLDKYSYGMPIERQVEKMAQAGLEVSNGTLTEGLLRIAPLLEGLYKLMKQKIAFEKLVHGDETRWYNWASAYDKNREEENPRQWLWGFFSGTYHVFVIAASRGAGVILDTLGQGKAKTVVATLVSDRYKAYPAAAAEVAFCWAHVRRDFVKIQIQYPTNPLLMAWTSRWLELIGNLFALNTLRVENQSKPEVFEAYEKQIREVLDQMQGLMNQPYTNKVQMAQVESMKNHWKGLTRFLEDPDIPLDNNLAERALRKPVVGRKNFYGNHSDRAKEATAIFYSIISTLKLHQIQPRKFLKQFLTTCAQLRGSPMKSEDLENFLPHVYAQRHPGDLLQD